MYKGNNYLVHHGIQGQKWGERNGPPYPLDYEAHSSREKRENSRVKLVNYDKAKSNKITKDKIKKIIGITAGAAVGAYVLYNGVNIMSGGYLDLAVDGLKNEIISKGMNLLSSESYADELQKSLQSLKELPSADLNLDIINNTKTPKEVIHKYLSDPDSLSIYEEATLMSDIKDGRFENCAFCTTSASLRQKGYDVVAGTSTSGNTPARMLTWWKGSHYEDLYGNKMDSPLQQASFLKTHLQDAQTGAGEYSVLENRLREFGNNSYGELTVFGSQGGHSVQFSVADNKVKIYDYQVKQEYDSIESFFGSSFFDYDKTMFMRLDNCTPNLPVMLKEGVFKEVAR